MAGVTRVAARILVGRVAVRGRRVLSLRWQPRRTVRRRLLRRRRRRWIRVVRLLARHWRSPQHHECQAPGKSGYGVPDSPIRGGLSRLTCDAVSARPVILGGGSWGKGWDVLRFFTRWG